MKILGVIPARGGSKGVPEKNIKLIGGIPLIVHTIKASIKSNLTKIIVSTESEKIANISESYGLKIPFVRPNNLTSDTAKSIDVVKHALNEMENIDNIKYDAVMMLQPTTPFRTTKNINDAISLLIKNEGADSVISVTNVEGNHPARMKYIENRYLIDPPFCELHENQNRQELIEMYIRNGAIYLTRRNIILNNSFKGSKCLPITMSKKTSINIDTIDDFEYAEFIYNKFLK